MGRASSTKATACPTVMAFRYHKCRVTGLMDVGQEACPFCGKPAAAPVGSSVGVIFELSSERLAARFIIRNPHNPEASPSRFRAPTTNSVSESFL